MDPGDCPLEVLGRDHPPVVRRCQLRRVHHHFLWHRRLRLRLAPAHGPRIDERALPDHRLPLCLEHDRNGPGPEARPVPVPPGDPAGHHELPRLLRRIDHELHLADPGRLVRQHGPYLGRDRVGGPTSGRRGYVGHRGDTDAADCPRGNGLLESGRHQGIQAQGSSGGSRQRRRTTRLQRYVRPNEEAARGDFAPWPL